MTQEFQFAWMLTAAMAAGLALLPHSWLRRFSHSDLRRAFEALLEEGRDGSVVEVNVRSLRLSLRFFKWESVQQGTRLELMLQLAPWSDDQRTRLEQALKDRGLSFRKRRRPMAGRDEGFLIVEANASCEEAMRLAHLVLEDGFGLRPDVELEVVPILKGIRTSTVSFAERSQSLPPRRVSLSEASWT